MAGFTFWHWLVVIAALAGGWGLVRLVVRSGVSPWWILPLLLPGIGGVAVLWFSYTRWPALERRPGPNGHFQ